MNEEDGDSAPQRESHTMTRPPSASKKTNVRAEIDPDPNTAEFRRRQREANQTYGRGRSIHTKNVKDKKLRANLKSLEQKYKDTTYRAREAEILQENDDTGFLEPNNELEKTYHVAQRDIVPEVSVQSAKQKLDLKLNELGPYISEFSRDSNRILLAGRKGHVATMDWRSGNLGFEIQLGETVRDATWLAHAQHVAVAQKKHVYIYDRQGVEIHHLQKHVEVCAMQYLPYHFLLATIGTTGLLKYMDVTEGKILAETPTKLGLPTAFRQNPYNAIMHTGDRSGNVSLWSPNSSSYLAKIHTHGGPVRAIAVDRAGRYMVSSGQDKNMVVTDLRMVSNEEPFRRLQTYRLNRPGTSLDISDSGLVAVGWGTQASVFKDMLRKDVEDVARFRDPYMKFGGGREGTWGSHDIERVRFCPFEDLLGVSHAGGFSTAIIPGAGRGYDATEVNPTETTKQRQETEVRNLLQKLRPETISLDPNYIGNLDTASAETRKKEKDLDREPEDAVARIKNRARGRNSSLRKYLRKRGGKNIIDDQRARAQELYDRRKKATQSRQEDDFGPALARFAKRPKP